MPGGGLGGYEPLHLRSPLSPSFPASPSSPSSPPSPSFDFGASDARDSSLRETPTLPVALLHVARRFSLPTLALLGLAGLTSLTLVAGPQPLAAGLSFLGLQAPVALETCRTVQPGEQCYKDVMWARKQGIYEHPEWYPGLTTQSTFEDFQVSRALQEHGCPAKPCLGPGQPFLVVPQIAQTAVETPPCETYQFGTDCYFRVMWVMRTGLWTKPEWYQGLDMWSSFEDIQHHLMQKHEVCAKEPCPAVRNPFPRTPSMSTNAACNSLIPGQALGLPDIWPLAEGTQEKCFDEMHAVRQQGEQKKESWLVEEDKKLMKGRNWCWVGFKEFGCHRTWSDHLTWKEMQDLAVKSEVTVPMDFRPVQIPELCDKRENGAPMDWTPEELARSKDWFDKFVSVYVLSLPSSARRPKVQQCLQGDGIDFTFVDGIDLRQPGALFNAQNEGFVPLDFNFERAQAKAYTEGQNMGSAGSIMGTVGCAAAHFKAQRSELGKPPEMRRPITLIFEDDVCPEKDFIQRLWSLVVEELPCDWDAVSLYSRCPFGRCVSERLTRVQPDTNEPMWRCRHGVNWGFQGMLYRTENIERIQKIWQPIVFDEEKPNCLYLDNALAAISDRVNFYAVPAAQSPGFLRELDWSGSERINMNHEAGGGNPWHTCATSGCNKTFNAGDKCQCNDQCFKFNDCCHDYEANCQHPGPSTFCFTLMQAGSYEQTLLQDQLSIGAGIFGCSAYSVFSNQGVTLYGPQNVQTSVIEGAPAVGYSSTYDTALNTAVFVKVWNKLFTENRFADYDWTVKADADTVFIPGRLVEHLRPNTEGYPNGRTDAVYVLNCGLGLHGPIEVLSQKATMLFKDGGLVNCVTWRVSDWSITGEDDFMSKCWQRLGIERIIDFGVLDEAHCGGTVSPCMSGKVAFHPFKDVSSWRTCLWQAQR